ncbi:TetR/AcrR family transcriptional regulator [Erwinia pyrifoliae]|uniref:TetR/AcrR family transcriptional regulator n=1 Tax=Erwinia pyrifoliae TaxID=79967 RepID=A0ABY5XCP0_ERWPY|nr:TetR/AcrR family transcriptional regulator [Erwinia pyrifoliae]AUX72629.1 TetR/AcrR family transcriptional regulator [Erwinia pyrifoliae]MCA8877109.1 TetR/AcrR family transcriptional regulator [Erwinia pyrifoliae]MCT2387258.1 TetR/AcrR family transcriptional regulator [Erwinia pyrifoliae]MCU8587142.1 TetR/AcrR family transcriptional regulator [Erwinia pyrifoliae]UWS31003.1 TetR/AcrR family transcriptional regulator [Erwinia pyrifoliae]
MNKTTRFDTREHLLNTGEQLCLQRGFNGMGLIELLRQAEVPKGSFYYYFPSKEAFGVAMLQRYFARNHQYLNDFLNDHQGSYRQRVLDYYDRLLLSCQVSSFAGCLYVKLSAEVCDLSEAMRGALEAGSSKMIGSLAATLNKAQQQGTLSGQLNCASCAQTIYTLWLGASLQSKICREKTPLLNALQEMGYILRGA